ncbi:Enolase [Parasponia andersonii]|uniref:phosphopyruvate hydratase n=1 Tax=Parasponia andersonii TaxID=3476 RepID=A0A2P5E3Y3_PARAD|nr:Enolase [Parasponia andersonii]
MGYPRLGPNPSQTLDGFSPVQFLPRQLGVRILEDLPPEDHGKQLTALDLDRAFNAILGKCAHWINRPDRMAKLISKEYGEDASKHHIEGSYAPNIQEVKQGLDLPKTAIDKCGFVKKVVIGAHAAASGFYESDNKTYDVNFKRENNGESQKISGDSLAAEYTALVRDYPVVSSRDPFHVDDLKHHSDLTNEIGRQVQIMGAELLVTKQKMHQVGTITECIEAVKMCKDAGWRVVVASHGSGEAIGDYVADLSVGLGSDQIMVGQPCNSIRRDDSYKRLPWRN